MLSSSNVQRMPKSRLAVENFLFLHLQDTNIHNWGVFVSARLWILNCNGSRTFRSQIKSIAQIKSKWRETNPIRIKRGYEACLKNDVCIYFVAYNVNGNPLCVYWFSIPLLLYSVTIFRSPKTYKENNKHETNSVVKLRFKQVVMFYSLEWQVQLWLQGDCLFLHAGH